MRRKVISMTWLLVGSAGLAACGPIRSTTTPLDVADDAPAFELPNQAGHQVSLAALTQDGPALLVFNRGHR